MTLSLVVGGTRSGKSRHAEALAAASGRRVIYLATADRGDAAMAGRIETHASRRPGTWELREAAPGQPLARILEDTDGACVLLDGFGVWVAGLMHQAGAFESHERIADVETVADGGVSALIAAARSAEVIVVAEEAGLGVLPGDPASRAWLDIVGGGVQQLSDAAARIDLVVAGRPIAISGARPSARRGPRPDPRPTRPPAPTRDAHEGKRRDGPPLTVVGVGADGWSGLGERAREAIGQAALLVGSERQLALIPDTPAERRAWPAPMSDLVDELASGAAGPACILASGDPMLHGIGATLAGRVDARLVTVIPAPSAFSLACAELGWDEAHVALVSLTRRPVDTVRRMLQPARRIVVFAHGADGARELGNLLVEDGFGPSRLVVMERLGSAEHRVTDLSATEARSIAAPREPYLVAVECVGAPGARPLPLVPGLPDDAYEHDGQLTKRDFRAITIAALAPMPGDLLWDVGAGSGSIGIEWLRAEDGCRALAIEPDGERADRIERNAAALGVPQLEVVRGRAPEALAGLEPPDAVFVGGGVAHPGVLEASWDALRPGGRIAANAVTLEAAGRLEEMCATHGGGLRRVSIEHAEPLGRFTTWRPQLPIVQWSATKDGP